MDAATNPIFSPSRPIKVLFSPGHGAGWITYAPRAATDAFLVWMLTYEPLIEALDRHAKPEKLEELMTNFHHEARVKFGMERLITARVSDLFVAEVAGAFEVREVEGMERLVDVTRRREIHMAVHMGGNGGGGGEREREREAREMGEARERGIASTPCAGTRGMKV